MAKSVSELLNFRQLQGAKHPDPQYRLMLAMNVVPPLFKLWIRHSCFATSSRFLIQLLSFYFIVRPTVFICRLCITSIYILGLRTPLTLSGEVVFGKRKHKIRDAEASRCMVLRKPCRCWIENDCVTRTTNYSHRLIFSILRSTFSYLTVCTVQLPVINPPFAI
jgi:hypothetical protein